MNSTFNKAKYINNKGSYEIRNYFDDTLYKTELSSTIPTDSSIIPDVDGNYIGVYYVEGDYFVPDYWYDNNTGWIWLSELTWEINMAKTL